MAPSLRLELMRGTRGICGRGRASVDMGLLFLLDSRRLGWNIGIVGPTTRRVEGNVLQVFAEGGVILLRARKTIEPIWGRQEAIQHRSGSYSGGGAEGYIGKCEVNNGKCSSEC
jgi:hypothetical protein